MFVVFVEIVNAMINGHTFGGDGSASLTAFHIKLGYNYLVGYPNGMKTLMTSVMIGNNNSGYNGMMGNNYNNGYDGMLGYLGWPGILMGTILLILAITAILFFVKGIRRH